MTYKVFNCRNEKVGELEYAHATGRWVAITCYDAVRQFNITARDETQGVNAAVPPERAINWVLKQYYNY